MKRFKQVDLVVQGILLFIGLGVAIKGLYFGVDNFLILYFVVGGWQLVSCLIHYLVKFSSAQSANRIFYIRSVFVIFIAGLISYTTYLAGAFSLIMLYLIFLLWFSPLFAFYYFRLCWKEYRLMEMRALVHLK